MWVFVEMYWLGVEDDFEGGEGVFSLGSGENVVEMIVIDDFFEFVE